MNHSSEQDKKKLTLNQLVENPSENEKIKDKSNYLRGTIVEDLAVGVSANISADNAQLTKFHGTYIQDDRDQRLIRQQKKLEPAWSFMTRVRIPGGVLSAKQWVATDDIADKWANGRIKLTTRQAVQFHGIIKFDLKKSMQDLHAASMDSIAACGDVNRNVMCSSLPDEHSIHAQTLPWADAISAHLLPQTSAWYDIWIDGAKQEQASLESESVEPTSEPIYGKHYLPRKFKIAIAIPPFNDTDIYSNDIGLVAIGNKGKLAGFNVFAGGGLGTTHADDSTYARLASAMGFCKPDQVLKVCENIMTIQRDYGNRSVRKNARLKYTIDKLGVEWFKEELQKRCGFSLTGIKPFVFEHNGDHYGWSTDAQGLGYLLLHIEHGRVYDTGTSQVKKALREIADKGICDFRLTGNQNLILGGIQPKHKAKVSAVLAKYKVNENANDISAMRRHAIACVALPTCALAMAEAQRYLPELIGKIEPILSKYELLQDDINIRMTGCPNGCARPWLGEIAFIGKSLNRYNMYLGAAFDGSRMNALYRENIDETMILDELESLIEQFAKKRRAGEHFGDFAIREKWVDPSLAGRTIIPLV